MHLAGWLKDAARRFLPRRLKPHRILARSLRGARLVTSWHDYPGGITGRTEQPLLAWFQQAVRPGETWLDIGAHYGYTAIALSRLVGRGGRVFAFEPVVATAGCVAQTGRLNRLPQLMTVPIGLGAPETMSYVQLPLERGMADQTRAVEGQPGGELLQIARLDWLWPLLNGGTDAVHGVKIDVQGMEAGVLRGMTGILRRHQPTLAIEFHVGVDRREILELLASCGYRSAPRGIEPQRREGNGALDDNCSYVFTATGAAA